MAAMDPKHTGYRTGETRSTSHIGDEPRSERLSEGINEAKHKARELSEEVKGRAAQQAGSLFSEQKGRAARELENMADAFRRAGEQFREKDEMAFAHYAEKLSEGMDRFSYYVRERNMQDLFEEMRSLARRQPAWFLSGAFATGLLLARFLKSSAPSEHEAYDVREYSSGYGGEAHLTERPVVGETTSYETG